jgi:hypothetical protein
MDSQHILTCFHGRTALDARSRRPRRVPLQTMRNRRRRCMLASLTIKVAMADGRDRRVGTVATTQQRRAWAALETGVATLQEVTAARQTMLEVVPKDLAFKPVVRQRMAPQEVALYKRMVAVMRPTLGLAWVQAVLLLRLLTAACSLAPTPAPTCHLMVLELIPAEAPILVAPLALHLAEVGRRISKEQVVTKAERVRLSGKHSERHSGRQRQKRHRPTATAVLVVLAMAFPQALVALKSGPLHRHVTRASCVSRSTMTTRDPGSRSLRSHGGRAGSLRSVWLRHRRAVAQISWTLGRSPAKRLGKALGACHRAWTCTVACQAFMAPSWQGHKASVRRKAPARLRVSQLARQRHVKRTR